MDVVVNELQSTVEVGAEEALLEPSVLRRIVAAVQSQLADERAASSWEARERDPGAGRRGS